ncbi:DUF1570 domain-containing protein [Candidatus Uabimicrobium sp. HlEnr_7]|uniref:DUF1570 domain-containing protein n=1 Tax=Candidatus Uabimicrobium helgolandensis TaxID=3095367 RepID=UPI003558A74B
MIIYGTKCIEKTIKKGLFLCPTCCKDQKYSLVGVHKYFTLYFIPIIPLGKISSHVKCGHCCVTFDRKVLRSSRIKEKSKSEISQDLQTERTHFICHHCNLESSFQNDRISFGKKAKCRHCNNLFVLSQENKAQKSYKVPKVQKPNKNIRRQKLNSQKKNTKYFVAAGAFVICCAFFFSYISKTDIKDLKTKMMSPVLTQQKKALIASQSIDKRAAPILMMGLDSEFEEIRSRSKKMLQRFDKATLTPYFKELLRTNKKPNGVFFEAIRELKMNTLRYELEEMLSSQDKQTSQEAIHCLVNIFIEYQRKYELVENQWQRKLNPIPEQQKKQSSKPLSAKHKRKNAVDKLANFNHTEFINAYKDIIAKYRESSIKIRSNTLVKQLEFREEVTNNLYKVDKLALSLLQNISKNHRSSFCKSYLSVLQKARVLNSSDTEKIITHWKSFLDVKQKIHVLCKNFSRVTLVNAKKQIEESFSEKGYIVQFLKQKSQNYLALKMRQVKTGNWQKLQKYRIFCVVDKWENGKRIWNDVISSSRYINFSTIKTQEQLNKQVTASFIQELNKWQVQQKRKLIRLKKKKIIKGRSLQVNLDKVFLKNGTTKEGLIIQEKDDVLFLLIFDEKLKEKSTKRLVMKKNIKSIRKISPESRARKIRYLDRMAKNDFRKKINFEKSDWKFGEGEALFYEGEYFQLFCNTPLDFSQEVAFRVDLIFKAYKKFFFIKSDTKEKVKIYVFNSMEEYYKSIDHAFSNPAFFLPQSNYIAAGCNVDSYQKVIEKLKNENEETLKNIKEYRKHIKSTKKEITGIRQDTSRKLEKMFQQKNITLKEYKKRHRKLLDLIQEERKKLYENQKVVKSLEDKIKLYNYKNKQIFLGYIETMIETIYHEAFHAFLHNFMFTKKLALEAPRWLNEGLAQLFEDSLLLTDDLVIGKQNKDRIRYLKKFIEHNETISIKSLVTAGASEFLVRTKNNLERSNLSYIQSWAVTYYIATRYNLKKSNILNHYVYDLWQGVPPVKAFEKLVNQDIEKFEASWKRFMRKQIKSLK